MRVAAAGHFSIPRVRPSRKSDYLPFPGFCVILCSRMIPRCFWACVIAVVTLGFLGCKTTAELYVWQPPRLHNASAQKMVLAKIVGPTEMCDALQAAMLARVPVETSKNLTLATQFQLQEQSSIQLAAATETLPSDVALQAEARRRGYDYLLFGEILIYPSAHTTVDSGATQVSEGTLSSDGTSMSTESAGRVTEGDEGEFRIKQGDRVVVSWRLLDVAAQIDRGGTPVSLDVREDAADSEAFIDELASNSWELLLPHITQVQTTLVRPRLMLGSTEVRRGVELAQRGQWREAAAIWQKVVEEHPRNHAALHNLAMAMVAQQEFGKAKRFAQQALRYHRSSTYESSVVWIEQQQMQYTRAFQLDMPEEGWLFSPDE